MWNMGELLEYNIMNKIIRTILKQLIKLKSFKFTQYLRINNRWYDIIDEMVGTYISKNTLRRICYKSTERQLLLP